MGPTFSVTSIRPSGRKAIFQGMLKVVTEVMLNGTLASGFWSPALTWALAGTAAAVANKRAAIFNVFIFSPLGIFCDARFEYGPSYCTKSAKFHVPAAKSGARRG